MNEATLSATLGAWLSVATESAAPTSAVDDGLLWINQVLWLILFLWTIVIKIIATWRAARAGHKFWFLLLMLTNTLGVLEIVYLCYLSKFDLSSFLAFLGIKDVRVAQKTVKRSKQGKVRE